MNYTDEQRAVIDTAGMDNHILIQACAGSGKTSTIAAIGKQDSRRTLFLAFNKAVATEISAHYLLAAKTLHSFGYSICSTISRRKVQLERYLVADYLRDRMNLKKRAHIVKYLVKLVSLIKSSGVTLDLDDEKLVPEFFANISANLSANLLPPVMLNHEADEAFSAVAQYFRDLNKWSSTFAPYLDFDDMIYLAAFYIPHFSDGQVDALLNRVARHPVRTILIDEAQDLNNLQITTIKRIIDADKQVIAVGDRHQAIYGFRGALSNSMDQVAAIIQPDMVEMPLTICFRCPSSHIEIAEKWAPEAIRPRPGAPRGTVKTIQEKELVSEVHGDTSESILVLSRFRSSLIRVGMQLLCRGMSGTIQGRDLVDTLIAEINKLPSDMATSDAIVSVREAYTKRIAGVEERGYPSDGLQDWLTAITSALAFGSQVRDVIEMLFKLKRKNDGRILLSTVHSAKGLEADSVYILRGNEMPFAFRNQDGAALRQEVNLAYVAFTRSRDRLAIVKSDV